MEEHFYTALSDDYSHDAFGSHLNRTTESKRRFLASTSLGMKLVSATELAILFFYSMNILEFQSSIILGVSVAFTWFHIWLALKMCFFPLNFRGFVLGSIRLGWEGIVPSKAERMASKSCELMIDKLIIVDDIIDSINGPDLFRFLKSSGIIADMNDSIIQAMTEKYLRNLFLPDLIRRQIYAAIEDASYASTQSFVHALTTRLKDRSFFDIRELIVSKFVEDKKLLVNLFTSTGKSELNFIEVSGAVMGLICGFAQIALLNTNLVQSWNPYLVFSVTNFFIGYITNWIALYIIFNPVEPIRVSRKIEIQGLFLRRQVEASRVYSQIVTDSVLNLDEIIKFLQRYPSKWLEIKSMFVRSVSDTVQETLPSTFSLSRRRELSEFISNFICEKISKNKNIFHLIIHFIHNKLNLFELIQTNLIKLPPRDFEQMLHPVFQEDEFLLIFIGGILGALVGILQVALFHS